MTWLHDLIIRGRPRCPSKVDPRTPPDRPSTKTIADLDDFQRPLAACILRAMPQAFTVDERMVWQQYRKPNGVVLYRVPMMKMQEIAEVLECSFSVAVWAYVYKFWWGGWEYHPYTPHMTGTIRPQELCGLRTPNGFQCHLPKEAHAELRTQPHGH